MVARADTNQCHRRVAYDMAQSIQVTRVMSANMTHLTKILAVNHKQLSNDIIDPLFLWYLWVCSSSRWSHSGQSIQIVKSFVTSENWFWNLMCHKNSTVHRSPFCLCSQLLSSWLPLGHAYNLCCCHTWQGRQGRIERESTKRKLVVQSISLSHPSWASLSEQSTLASED
jgi:hypothetical protein